MQRLSDKSFGIAALKVLHSMKTAMDEPHNDYDNDNNEPHQLFNNDNYNI